MCLFVCVCVCACLAFESGVSSGHTDLIVQSLLVDLYPIQHIPLSQRLRNRPLTPSPPFTFSLFLSLSLFFPPDGFDLVTVVFHPEPGSQKESTQGETYRFTASRARHYLAIAHQQIHQQAGALIDASCRCSGSNKLLFILSP